MFLLMKKNKFKFKTSLKTGDKIYINSGKFKGKISNILKVFPKLNKVSIKGINIKKCHFYIENKRHRISTIKERPIHISNINLYNES